MLPKNQLVSVTRSAGIAYSGSAYLFFMGWVYATMMTSRVSATATLEFSVQFPPTTIALQHQQQKQQQQPAPWIVFSDSDSATHAQEDRPLSLSFSTLHRSGRDGRTISITFTDGPTTSKQPWTKRFEDEGISRNSHHRSRYLQTTIDAFCGTSTDGNFLCIVGDNTTSYPIPNQDSFVVFECAAETNVITNANCACTVIVGDYDSILTWKFCDSCQIVTSQSEGIANTIPEISYDCSAVGSGVADLSPAPTLQAAAPPPPPTAPPSQAPAVSNPSVDAQCGFLQSSGDYACILGNNSTSYPLSNEQSFAVVLCSEETNTLTNDLCQCLVFLGNYDTEPQEDWQQCNSCTILTTPEQGLPNVVPELAVNCSNVGGLNPSPSPPIGPPQTTTNPAPPTMTPAPFPPTPTPATGTRNPTIPAPGAPSMPLPPPSGNPTNGNCGFSSSGDYLCIVGNDSNSYPLSGVQSFAAIICREETDTFTNDVCQCVVFLGNYDTQPQDQWQQCDSCVIVTGQGEGQPNTLPDLAIECGQSSNSTDPSTTPPPAPTPTPGIDDNNSTVVSPPAQVDINCLNTTTFACIVGNDTPNYPVMSTTNSFLVFVCEQPTMQFLADLCRCLAYVGDYDQGNSSTWQQCNSCQVVSNTSSTSSSSSPQLPSSFSMTTTTTVIQPDSVPQIRLNCSNIDLGPSGPTSSDAENGSTISSSCLRQDVSIIWWIITTLTTTMIVLRVGEIAG